MLKNENSPRPSINVTPLIDVLLVLLIIFMVAVPLKPARFSAQLPTEPEDLPPEVEAHIWTLVVTILPDRDLMLNALPDMGTVDDTSKLSAALVKLFAERVQNRSYRYEMLAREDLPAEHRIERTVFIKAPGSIKYGEVVKVIDGIKGAGATPIGLDVR